MKSRVCAIIVVMRWGRLAGLEKMLWGTRRGSWKCMLGFYSFLG